MRFEKLTEEAIELIEKYTDEGITDVILKMNKLPFLATTWSCGGHILVKDCMLCHDDIRFIVEKDNEIGKQFIEELERLIEKNYEKFVQLTVPTLFFGDPHELNRLGFYHPQYYLKIKNFEYPDLKKKSKKKREAFLKKKFKKTYGKFHTALKSFIDKWIS